MLKLLDAPGVRSPLLGFREGAVLPFNTGNFLASFRGHPESGSVLAPVPAEADSYSQGIRIVRVTAQTTPLVCRSLLTLWANALKESEGRSILENYHTQHGRHQSERFSKIYEAPEWVFDGLHDSRHDEDWREHLKKNGPSVPCRIGSWERRFLSQDIDAGGYVTFYDVSAGLFLNISFLMRGHPLDILEGPLNPSDHPIHCGIEVGHKSLQASTTQGVYFRSDGEVNTRSHYLRLQGEAWQRGAESFLLPGKALGESGLEIVNGVRLALQVPMDENRFEIANRRRLARGELPPGIESAAQTNWLDLPVVDERLTFPSGIQSSAGFTIRSKPPPRFDPDSPGTKYEGRPAFIMSFGPDVFAVNVRQNPDQCFPRLTPLCPPLLSFREKAIREAAARPAPDPWPDEIPLLD